jgi:L-asparaginase
MEARPKVLILYTGGTIGMIKDSITGELKNVDFNHITEHVPEINRLNIEIDSVSIGNPVDSSEMNIQHWKEIATTIFEKYQQYDGFVVLHGSDTMAYTASALSFMFDGLKKPVILTGSQLPIGVIRTDGKENLITSLEIAAAKSDQGDALIQEVAVYFDYKLFRGNRCTKDSAENFEAFRSPNYMELASAGVRLNYNTDRFYSTESEELKLNTAINNRIALIKLFPGVDFQLFGNLIKKDLLDGLVIETFGAGNAPRNKTFEALLRSFIDDGGIVLNITQCNSGSVWQGLYETSSVFNRIGVVSGKDMTTEAAVTKLMTSLNAGDQGYVAELLETNLRGELTV